MIPPEQDAEFVASMEELLETYARPYDAHQPVVCMDEQPVQLVRETRPPLAATAEHPQRVADYEYERAGTAAVFLFCEPLGGWREATARERRTKQDWALEVARLLEGRYANCAKITLVCDNIWFAPEVPTNPDPMNGGLRQYIRPLGGTAMVPGHDGLRTPRSS